MTQLAAEVKTTLAKELAIVVMITVCQLKLLTLARELNRLNFR